LRRRQSRVLRDVKRRQRRQREAALVHVRSAAAGGDGDSAPAWFVLECA
jgi:hypothetical protein